MRKLYLLLTILFLIDFGWGQWGPFKYISPGIQIGYNNNEGLFYGFQTSIGISIKDEFSTTSNDLYRFIPSICFGFKRYHKKYNEKYIDLQTTFFENKFIENMGPPIGIGIGKNFFNNSSNYRLKCYTWYLTCFTIDYELERKSFNFSLIPILPRQIGIEKGSVHSL